MTPSALLSVPAFAEGDFWKAQQDTKVSWLRLFSLTLSVFFTGIPLGQAVVRLFPQLGPAVPIPSSVTSTIVLVSALWCWRKKFTPQYMVALSLLFGVASIILIGSDIGKKSFADLLLSYLFSYFLSASFNFMSYWLVIRGHYRLSAWLLVLAGLNFLEVRCLQSSLFSPSILGIILVVVAAVVLMSAREAIFLTAITMLTTLLVEVSRALFSLYPVNPPNPNSFTGSLETLIWAIFSLALVAFLLLGPLGYQKRLLQKQNNQLYQALHELQNRQQLSEEVSRQVLELAARLKISAQQQASSSQEHAATTNQIKVSVTELVTTAGAIAGMAEEVNRTVLNVAQASRQIEDTTHLAASQSQEGFAAVGQTTTVSQEVGQLYQELVEAMEELDNKSASMEKILKLISTISGETHLIALNAAIEAAGASEYGERFGVVAREIKNLATRANDSTREVVAIIQEVINVVHHVAQAARGGYEKASQMEEVTRRAGEVIRRLSEIAGQSEKQASMISQAAGQVRDTSETIKNSTFQQQQTITQIMDSLEGLNNVAQQNAEGSQLVAITSNNLEVVSQKLNLALSKQREQVATL